jgi:hypothetical protein
MRQLKQAANKATIGGSEAPFEAGTADYNDVREEIKFENQNSIPHCPASPTLSVSYISVYDFPTL